MKRTPVLLIILLLLGLASWTSVALTQPSQAPVVEAVEAVGMTVADTLVGGTEVVAIVRRKVK